MELARSRPHGGATQRNFHSTKYSNGTDLTKFLNPRNSDKRKFKRNFRSKLNRDKVGEPDCIYTEGSSVTYKADPANYLSETHSQANRWSPNHSPNISGVALPSHSNGLQGELTQDMGPPTPGFQEGNSSETHSQANRWSPDNHSTNISDGALPSHSNVLQGEFPLDMGPPTPGFQEGNSSESFGQMQRDVPETFKPCTDYQPAVSEQGSGYKNFQPCNNQERTLTSSPLDLHYDQTADNNDVHRFTNVQETDFPQPSCNEQIYISPSVGSYPINNWQLTSDVVYLQDARHFTPLFQDSNRNLWDRPPYMENSLINPHFEHTRVLKTLPMYTDLYYQLPGPLNAAWGMPYYTRGGLFVNPLGMYSCR